MANKVFIIGGGGFGARLAHHLLNLGCDVTVADKQRDRVNALRTVGLNAVELDATAEAVFADSEVLTADAVVISTGASVQAGIYAALLLKHLKVRRVIACAADEKCARLLKQIGAEVFHPLHHDAEDFARQLALHSA